MEARRQRAEDAASPVVATVLLVAVTIALAAGVHVWLKEGGFEVPQVPRHLVVVQWERVDDARVHGLVASASAGLTYDKLEVHVDGRVLAYASTVDEDAWHAQRDLAPAPVTDRVRAGDTWVVPLGSDLRVADAQLNLLLLDLPLPSS